MKNTLANIYEQMLLNESEKSNLENPSNDEVGNLKVKQELFGSKPKPVEGPEKAKVQKGPSYSVTTGSSSAPKVEKSSMKGGQPAKETKTEAPKEMKDTEVDPKKKEENEEENESSENKEKKKEKHDESLVLSAFEALFKKTLNEELGEQEEMASEGDAEISNNETESHEDDNNETEDDMAEDDEEEGDLISDLKDLQTKLADILAKLEDTAEDNELEAGQEEEYTDEDFEKEFGEEETEVKEAVEKPKVLSDAHGKKLLNKNNKVGNLHPKGGKAHTGDASDEPEPKPLGDKKKALQKGGQVHSTVKKGDFIK